MLGQVMVTTESPSVLRPLLRTAIQNEAKSLTHGIRRTRERLIAFEEQFGMTSEEFERRYTAAEIDESLASIEWLGEIKMLRLLSEQKLALDGARSSDRHLPRSSALKASPVVQSHDIAFDKRPRLDMCEGSSSSVRVSYISGNSSTRSPRWPSRTLTIPPMAMIFRYDNTPVSRLYHPSRITNICPMGRALWLAPRRRWHKSWLRSRRSDLSRHNGQITKPPAQCNRAEGFRSG